jgi:hypothetical protein
VGSSTDVSPDRRRGVHRIYFLLALMPVILPASSSHPCRPVACRPDHAPKKSARPPPAHTRPTVPMSGGRAVRRLAEVCLTYYAPPTPGLELLHLSSSLVQADRPRIQSPGLRRSPSAARSPSSSCGSDTGTARHGGRWGAVASCDGCAGGEELRARPHLIAVELVK